MSMLRRIVVPLLLAASAALSGCANLGQSAGYEVQSQKDIVHKRQEPWHNLVLTGDTRKAMAYKLALMPMPAPLPKEWKQELVDASRTYTVDRDDGSKAKKTLARVVFRALVYRRGEVVGMFDVVINPQSTGLFVLLPPGSEYEGTADIVVVASDASWLMTSHGEIVNVEEQDVTRLPQGFFEEHPSPLNRTIRMNRADWNSEKFFADLEELFPRHISVDGFEYSGRPDALTVLGTFTRVDQPLDRVVSCGSMTVSTGMTPVSLAISMVRNLYVAGQSDCMK